MIERQRYGHPCKRGGEHNGIGEDRSPELTGSGLARRILGRRVGKTLGHQLANGQEINGAESAETLQKRYDEPKHHDNVQCLCAKAERLRVFPLHRNASRAKANPEHNLNEQQKHHRSQHIGILPFPWPEHIENNCD